ncbi:molybdenum ABC transporter ATP-binding protein [Tropicimonas sp. S265A]|uniref:molybdenum ABC transporter ATP-binding protein n=1 Tax=Tropicimonas sp. S265A TaxID=3415134 RepID=UPI003C7E4368
MTLSVHLQHGFGAFALDAGFEAPQGITVLFGRSGSGKTTIVNAVAGLLQPDAGQISLNGEVLLDTASGVSLPPHKRGLGYIFQEGRLFPHLTVRQNLTYGQVFTRGRPPGPNFDQVVDLLGIGALQDRRPGALSGGEKQRVAIGRALLARPRLILADEPLAALDEARKAEILPYFERLRDEVAIPILYVSHAAAEVARLATTVVALQDGRVARQGPAIEVLSDPMVTPAGVRAAGAVLEARVVAHHPDGLSELDAQGQRLFLPQLDRPVGAQIRVRIAAQDVILSRTAPEGLSALNILSGEIDQIRPGDGPGTLVSLRTPAGTVLARVTQRSAAALDLAPGRSCFAVLKSVAVAPQDVG